jgi:hypothetical protein
VHLFLYIPTFLLSSQEYIPTKEEKINLGAEKKIQVPLARSLHGTH